MEKPLSAYRGDGPYVFVCYAHEDSDAVYREITWLNDRGVNVWYDEGISPGHEWREELAAAIQGCTRVLFFITPHSIAREHCRRELNFAQEENREVVAIHLEPTEMPAGLRLGLNNRQAILKHELSDDEFHKRLIRVTQGGDIPNTRTAPPSPGKVSNSKVGFLVVAMAILALAAGAWWIKPDDKPRGVTESEPVKVADNAPQQAQLHNSIAVLPFVNLSPDQDNAYFAAGIHEEILNQLTKISDLSVIARTTMMQYANSPLSVPEIGKELNVQTVMEGSVRYADNRVRITAQLIDARSGAHLWSQAYEDELHDIFGIQVDIATRVSDSLRAELSAVERERIAQRKTSSEAAHAHYLKAIALWGNFAGVAAALDELDSAIALDSEFAAAMAFKAVILSISAAYADILNPNMKADDQAFLMNEAERLANQALRVDGQEHRAYMAMSFVHNYYREWAEGHRSAERAVALGPNDYFTANIGQLTALRNGDRAEAARRAYRAANLNPADAASIWGLAENFYNFQDWTLAKVFASLACELLPEGARGFALLGKVQARLGDPEAAKRAAMEAERRNPGPPDLADIAFTYGIIGEAEQAERIYKAAGGGDESRNPSLLWQFTMHMAIKDYDGALRYLERSVRENLPFTLPFVIHISSDNPDFDALRNQPRFEEVLNRLKVPLRGSANRTDV